MKPSSWNPEEQRRSARIDVDLAAEVFTDWLRSSPARVVNISRHGIAIEGPGPLIELVFPNFNHKQGNNPGVIKIRAGLLEGARELSKPYLELDSQSAYVKRVGQDRFMIGLSFLDLEEEVSERLESFLGGL